MAALNEAMFESNANPKAILETVKTLLMNEPNNHSSTDKLFNDHFDFVLNSIVPMDKPIPLWTSSDVSKAAFDALIRESPHCSWKAHKRVIPIIIANVQPKSLPQMGSMESNMAQYASIRGEEVISATAEVDVRLSLLALLEGASAHDLFVND